ncbi:hypothetical protein [Klebsiella pneumoniae IS10]|uniref:Uncharacterized protein n=1 Tax=Klebsiella pneumoniae IS43 TaxID=1432552 RepID=W1DWA2_KLEPN|nr:hypothetical protein [Klebsiella pneumoniae IS10]CDL12384.1 hypothetical protein [Klebsiella pneumoniae IS43]CDL52305.1 hypothetical protein [Klebsiella pneumoniae ISC21]
MRKRQVLSTAGEKLPAMGPGARHQAWDFCGFSSWSTAKQATSWPP